MTQYIADILLWLFVINHGIACGAGLYEERVILPISKGRRPWRRNGWRSITFVQLLL